MLKSILATSKSTSGIGWSCSIGLHAALLVGLTFVSWKSFQATDIVFASKKAERTLTVTLSKSEMEDANSDSMQIQVEVRPREVLIDSQRFQHASTSQPIVPSTNSEPRIVNKNLSRRSSQRIPQIDSKASGSIARRSLRRSPSAAQLTHVASVETTLPQFKNNRPPRYPLSAISQKHEGTVLLRIHLAKDGSVSGRRDS